MSKPVVKWNKPEQTPEIKVGEVKEYWVAARHTRHDGKVFEAVSIAQFVNMPVDFDEDGEPNTDDYLCDDDGQPISSVGWHSSQSHADFDNYYSPLFYTDSHTLLGWAEFEVPDFKS